MFGGVFVAKVEVARGVDDIRNSHTGFAGVDAAPRILHHATEAMMVAVGVGGVRAGRQTTKRGILLQIGDNCGQKNTPKQTTCLSAFAIRTACIHQRRTTTTHARHNRRTTKYARNKMRVHSPPTPPPRRTATSFAVCARSAHFKLDAQRLLVCLCLYVCV